MIAMSSAQSGFYASVKATAGALGLKSMNAGIGMQVNIAVLACASAALCIIERKGFGKARRLDKVKKAKALENPADIIAKELSIAEIQEHVSEIGGQFMRRSAQFAAEILSIVRHGARQEEVENSGGEDLRQDNGTNMRHLEFKKHKHGLNMVVGQEDSRYQGMGRTKEAATRFVDNT